MLLVPRTACLLAIAAQFCLLAADGARFTVSGVVVNSVTGEPLQHALVQSTGAEQKVAFTGQDGRFQLEGVPQGTMFFLAQKPGFSDPGFRHAPISVGAGTSLVTIKLAPESSIEGRITDSDGEAIEGLTVQCMNELIANGRKRWQMAGSAQTDETGNFHLQSLRAGAYLLKTSSQPLFPNFQNAGDALPQQAYPPRFYPDAADLSSAQPLTLHPGETARADFSIAPVPAFRVSGTANSPQGRAFGWVQSAEGGRMGGGIMVDRRTGAWHTPALPAGSWNILLESRNGPEAAYHAEQTVNVTSADIKNVQMALEPLSAIPVNVDSPAPPDQRQVQIQLLPDAPSLENRIFGSSRSPRNMSEAPMVRDVLPGAYTVVATPYGGDCLVSVSAGGVDLTRSPLVVSAGSQTASIDVTLADNCASIQGQVRMDGPTPDASVILAPSSRAIQAQSAPLKEDGSFAFIHLSPGDYRLYAVSTAAGLEYGNPEAMRQIDGASVTLTAKQKANVTLNLVTRDGN